MITVFVSSTFKDMQAERDALQQIVAPALNATATEYGKSVSFSDLRWGVNTLDLDSEKGARKVLDVCLDEIDRCEPPMIVILGYRYGWIPSQDTLKNSVERKRLMLQDLNMSVTALEIEYGALCRAPERTLFYFREIEGDAPERYLGEDEEHINKLNALKRRIENLAGRNLRTYRMKWNGQKLEGIEEFAKLVEGDVLRLLQPRWERDKNLTPFERERNTQWAFVNQKASYFRAKLPLLEELEKSVQNGAEKLIIKGASGMGKSTLFCSLAVRLKGLGYDVLPFIGGYTLESNDAFDILKNTVYYVEQKLSLPHFAATAGEDVETGRKQASVKDWRNRLEEVCGRYAAKGAKLVIMLDAADQLNDDENRNDLVFIPYNLSQNVRFIMTCTPDFPILGNYVALSPLDTADRKEIIKGILAPINKELDQRVVDEIVSKKGSDNPLYISLLVQRLLLLRADDFDKMTDPQTISAHQRAILSACPDELDGMSAALFKEAGTHVNGKLIQQSMEYIAATRHGLRISDLAALLDGQWNYLDFIHFVYYMNDSFMVRDDGRYDFTHKSLRSGLLKTGDKSGILKRLADHFLALPPTDSIRISELGYHLIKDDRYGEFVECVNSDGADGEYRKAFSAILHEQSCFDGGEWAVKLLKSGKEYGVGRDFCLFIGEEVALRFNSGDKEMAIVEKIMLAAIAILEELNDVKTEFLQAAESDEVQALPETDEAIESFGQMMNGMIGEMFNQGLFDLPEGCEGMTAEDFLIGMDEFKDMLGQTGGVKNFLKQSSTAFAYAQTVQGDSDDVHALSSCYRILSTFYSECGDIQRLNKALDIRERSVLLNQALMQRDADDITTALLLCSDYIAISRLYISAGTEEYRAKAAQTADAAMDMAKALKQNLKGTVYEQLSVKIYTNALELIADVKGGDSELDASTAEERIELYMQALDAVKAMEDGAEKSVATADIYKKLARAYRILGVSSTRGKKYQKLAYDYHFKSIAIYERLYKEKPEPELLDLIADGYRDVAWDYSGDSDDKKATMYFKKVVDLRKVLHEMLNSDDSGLKLANAYSELASVYLDNEDKKKYGEALAANSEYLSIVLEIEKKNDTVRSRQILSGAYDTLAKTYKTIGGEENLKLAYDLLKKRKNLERRIEIETGVLCDVNSAYINFNSLVEVVDEMKNGTALLEELIAIGEEDVVFYSKKCENSQDKNDVILLDNVLTTVADTYSKSEDKNHLKRAMALYEKVVSHEVEFFTYYTATIGMVRILIRFGGRENGLKAISLCKKIIDAADLDNCEELIKENPLSCIWIMDAADNLVKLLEKFEPQNFIDIEYYRGVSEVYQQALFDATEDGDFDDD